MNTTLSTSRAHYLGDRKRMEHLGWKCLVTRCWARCQDKVPIHGRRDEEPARPLWTTTSSSHQVHQDVFDPKIPMLGIYSAAALARRPNGVGHFRSADVTNDTSASAAEGLD